ncbi:ArsR/SmtB family transcription factor [Poseidonibacter lekithochrous]|uniref:ArsR/SmtB family transcription factor n=1 Tax=Poseidonibacter lekithochrous TaxID=1904463 RepID=UPI0008FC8FA3|nr:metalloregulator ArsR/SmtB family transcription factor [Poseidonibacter lekithochrous]QKJ22879.1 transcriptional regulator, ArsR family [Poseidonibacter lekithochrous]
MNDEQLAKCLAELGNITRLKVFKLLVKAGEEGMPVGAIQEKLNVPGSTLSHHITKLISADLVIQKREGRTLHCIANFEVLNSVVGQLQDQCCIGF